VEFLREEVIAAVRVESDPLVIAERIERAVRANFGAERVYVPALPDDRRQEALRMLQGGDDPESVARRLMVHTSTVYRWRSKARTVRRRTGLGGDDWVL
jgi:DNA-binding NarL/FixJ family response regulator